MITSSLLLAASLAVSPPTGLTDQEYDSVLRAIRTVESNNDPSAVGDGGKAIGVYQVWRPYWQDAIEKQPWIGGTYQDCFDPSYSDRIVRAYMSRYATQRRLGRNVTQEDIARIHNGGPNGYRKDATLKYWHKVQREMESQQR